MSLAIQFPLAYERGRMDCITHYAEVDAGRIEEHEVPPNPYDRPSGMYWGATEWHAYNVGWYYAIPDKFTPLIEAV